MNNEYIIPLKSLYRIIILATQELPTEPLLGYTDVIVREKLGGAPIISNINIDIIYTNELCETIDINSYILKWNN